MESFAVRIALQTPIITGRRLMLDAILAGLIYEQTGDLERAHNDIPLDRSRGVWAGSMVFLEGPSVMRKHQIISSLRAEHDINYDVCRPVKGKKLSKSALDMGRGEYKNHNSVYEAHHAAAIWFTGRGNAEQVEAMLSDLTGLGTKRNHGFGRIADIEFFESDNDLAGLMTACGKPSRAVPKEIWADIGGREAIFGTERFAPPYWKGDMTVCAVPRDNVVYRDEVDEMFGVV